jgi:hypothetical protein
VLDGASTRRRNTPEVDELELVDDRERTMGTWEKRIGGLLATAAAIAAAIAAILSLQQANDLQADANQLQAASLDSHLEEVMMGLDRHFVRYPHLRPYFYAEENRPRPLPRGSGPLVAQAWASAELVIDFADDVGAYVRNREMPDGPGKRWTRIVREYFRGSPITRIAWKSFADAYDETTACILGAPFGDAIRGWNAATNRPTPTPRDCLRSSAAH